MLEVRRTKGSSDDVKRKAGEITRVSAASDWVEANFQKEVLAVVQKTGIDLHKKYPVNSGSKDGPKKGPNTVKGFIPVGHMGRVCVIDNRQITALKYIHTPKAYVQDPKTHAPKRYRWVGDQLESDAEGEERKPLYRNPGKWMAYFASSKRVEEVTDAQVAECGLPRGWMDQCKHACKTQSGYVKLPPGDSKIHAKVVHVANTGAPKIHYRQKLGEATCIVDSFASLLHSIGRKQIASEIFQARKKIIGKLNTWEIFSKVVLKKSSHLDSQKVDLRGLDILTIPHHFLYVACLEGSDGKIDHAVTLHNGWIYDSNFESALPLSRKSLDLCCSSDDIPARFVKVDRALIFHGYSGLLNK
jgi:hypothetical protein